MLCKLLGGLSPSIEGIPFIIRFKTAAGEDVEPDLDDVLKVFHL